MKALTIVLALLLATPALAQRSPCQPTPWNPQGINCNGYRGYYGSYGIWDPYPGTRSGGQDALNYAGAVAMGLPVVVGALHGLKDLFTPEPDVVVADPVETVPAPAPGRVAAAGNWKKCFWISYNPTIANPRYRYGDRRFICIGPNGEYVDQAPPIN